MKTAIVIGLLLAVYGAAELLQRAAAWLMRPHAEERGYWLIPLRGDGQSAEWLIRYARRRCCDGVRPVLFDSGLTPRGEVLARDVCQRMQVDFLPREAGREIPKMTLQDREDTL